MSRKESFFLIIISIINVVSIGLLKGPFDNWTFTITLVALNAYWLINYYDCKKNKK